MHPTHLSSAASDGHVRATFVREAKAKCTWTLTPKAADHDSHSGGSTLSTFCTSFKLTVRLSLCNSHLWMSITLMLCFPALSPLLDNGGQVDKMERTGCRFRHTMRSTAGIESTLACSIGRRQKQQDGRCAVGTQTPSRRAQGQSTRIWGRTPSSIRSACTAVKRGYAILAVGRASSVRRSWDLATLSHSTLWGRDRRPTSQSTASYSHFAFATPPA